MTSWRRIDHLWVGMVGWVVSPRGRIGDPPLRLVAVGGGWRSECRPRAGGSMTRPYQMAPTRWKRGRCFAGRGGGGEGMA
jgi:hypothetical protein